MANTIGDDENNLLQGGRDADSLDGVGGDDTLSGRGGDDTLRGQDGNDILHGGNDNDIIDGGKGVDQLFGDKGDDLLIGGQGSTFDGGEGFDTINLVLTGSEGVTADLSVLLDGQTVDLGGTTLVNVEAGSITLGDGDNDITLGDAAFDLVGGAGDDRFVGGAGDNQLDGGAGSDTIEGGKGDDQLSGGKGVDTISFENAESGVTVHMNQKTGTATGGDGSDALRGFETAIGSHFNDSLFGAAASQSLVGGEGDDRLQSAGTKGHDTLVGGEGTDRLVTRGGTLVDGGAGDDSIQMHNGGDTVTGGAGSDRFAFFVDITKTGAASLITDLDASDVIDLRPLDADTKTAGDQHFTLVDQLDGHAGQAALSYNAKQDLTTLVLDLDGDSKADVTVNITGDHQDFNNFHL